MDTIVHHNKTFVKASALAKKYKYTSDYIGQLCRQGKVEAELVGRAWFISEDSLLLHQSERYPNLRTAEASTNDNNSVNNNNYVPVEKINIYPTLSKNTERQIIASNAISGINWQNKSQVTYQNDQAELHPVIQIAKINAAGNQNGSMLTKSEPAFNLKIAATKDSVSKLNFSELPEVFLTGNLEVKSFDELNDIEEITTVDQNALDNSEANNVPKNKVIISTEKRVEINSAILDEKSQHNLLDLDKPDAHLLIKKELSTLKQQYGQVTENKRIFPLFYIAPSLIVLGCVTVWLFTGLTRHIEVSGSNVSQSFHFNVAAANSTFSFKSN